MRESRNETIFNMMPGSRWRADLMARAASVGGAMGDLFASIKRGLEEAIAHQKGEKTGVQLFKPEEVNVKQVREKPGLTQEQFAATFGISLGTLRHWERGDRRPHGPALVLLNAVAREPGTVLRILIGNGEPKKGRAVQKKAA